MGAFHCQRVCARCQPILRLFETYRPDALGWLFIFLGMFRNVVQDRPTYVVAFPESTVLLSPLKSSISDGVDELPGTCFFGGDIQLLWPMEGIVPGLHRKRHAATATGRADSDRKALDERPPFGLPMWFRPETQ
jgi:hypothetical protein